MNTKLFNNIRAEISRRRWSIDDYCEKIGIKRRRFYNLENVIAGSAIEALRKVKPNDGEIVEQVYEKG